MKSYSTFYLAAFIAIVLFSAEPLRAVQRGDFESFLNNGSSSVNVAYFVPYDYNDNNEYPVIIGMHPAQTPGVAMRDMMKTSAEAKGAILACPDSPDGDGSAILDLLDWIKSEYSVDESKIILTGYSAGGYPTFQVGLANTDIFKGLIGIAPSVSTYGIDFSNVDKIAMCIIVGTSDHMYGGLKDFRDYLENLGGTVNFIEKTRSRTYRRVLLDGRISPGLECLL
jgi:predicted peptidase